MIEFYHNFSTIILFIHILSAFVWIGSMVGYVLSVYPSHKQIPNEKLMVRTSLRTIRRLTTLSFISSILLFLSGVIILYGASYLDVNPFLSTIINTKEFLWFFMFIITVVIYLKAIGAKKKCFASNSAGAKDDVRLVSNYLMIINIFLGLIALYFGMMFRN